MAKQSSLLSLVVNYARFDFTGGPSGADGFQWTNNVPSHCLVVGCSRDEISNFSGRMPEFSKITQIFATFNGQKPMQNHVFVENKRQILMRTSEF